MQTSSVMPDASVYNTSFFLLSLSPLPVAEYLCSLSVFLPWEQRAWLVCVEWGCWEYGKGMQRMAQVWLKERLEGWRTSPLLLSLPLSLFPLPFQKRHWMLDVDLSQCGSVYKKKKKKGGGGGWGEEGCVSTARQQKLIEQKKTLERRVHGSG